MRRYFTGLLALALSAGVLFIILLHSSTPLLYSPEYDAFTEKQVNPTALEPVGRDGSGSLLPLMSDLLDAPGTVIVNLEYGEMDIARRDLEEFRRLSESLDNLVINLDMSTSEVGDFRRMNENNLAILSELVDSTARLEELNTLEIRFRDSDNPAELTSIIYEGEGLRNRVSRLFDEYRSQEDEMVSVSHDFELDSSRYEESQDHFSSIVNRIDNQQEKRLYTLQTQEIPGRTPFHLTFLLTPGEAAFHEEIYMEGKLSGKETGNREIDLFVDAKKTATVSTDPEGQWEYRFFVGDIDPGRHTSFAVFDKSTYSEIFSFDVTVLDTYVILEEPSVTGDGLSCRGTLFSERGPVDGVSVSLMIDGRRAGSSLTDEKGFFEILARPAPGKHQVWAVFSDPGIPLSRSESRVYSVVIPPSSGQDPGFLETGENWPVLVLCSIVLAGSLVAGFAYIRRTGAGMGTALHKQRINDQEPGATPTGDSVNPATVPGQIQPLARDPLDDYSRIAEANISEAMHILFSYLRGEIAGLLALRSPWSCTPREICRKSSHLSIFRDLSAFIRHYEVIRYGNRDPDKRERKSMIDNFRAIRESLEGGEDN